MLLLVVLLLVVLLAVMDMGRSTSGGLRRFYVVNGYQLSYAFETLEFSWFGAASGRSSIGFVSTESRRQ